MQRGSQEQNSESLPVHALSEIISPLRLGTYLNSAGHDAQRALHLYIWNAQIGEAFHIPIQAVEVGLRNRVSDGLARAYGADWWQESSFLQQAGDHARSDLETVIRRLYSKGKDRTTGQIVASLSFGFWVGMLHKRHVPAIWSKHLNEAFPHLPQRIACSDLHREVREVGDLRNRIWHHEPIFRRDLSSDHARCLRIVSWLCPTKAAWIKPHCRVPSLIRQKPK